MKKLSKDFIETMEEKFGMEYDPETGDVTLNDYVGDYDWLNVVLETTADDIAVDAYNAYEDYDPDEEFKFWTEAWTNGNTNETPYQAAKGFYSMSEFADPHDSKEDWLGALWEAVSRAAANGKLWEAE